MTLVAVVLAAGAGRRAGGPKALLRIGNRSFLAHAADLLAPHVDRVVAVIGHGAARVRDEAGAPAGVLLCENPAPERGMLSSIHAGLEAAERLGGDGVLLHPVDHPLVSPGTVARVADALRAGAAVAVPAFGGRRGHPGGFARRTFAALRAAPPDRGARAVLAAHPEWVVHVEGDAGSLTGIDTPEDYARWIAPGAGPG